RGRVARGPELDRVRTRERDRLPHLHGDGAGSVRRAVLQLPARSNAESPTCRAPCLAEGRVPGLTRRDPVALTFELATFTAREGEEASLVAERPQMIAALGRAFPGLLGAWLAKRDDG